MSNYKSVRLEEHVYQKLMERMKPRESVSQVIERLLITNAQMWIHVQAITRVWEGED